MHPLRVEVHPDRHVSVHGEMVHGELIRTVSLADLAPCIDTMDLSGVTHIDAWGAYCLVQACKANPELRIVNPTPGTRRSIELAGVADLVPVASC